jgi:hypothetical protein
VRHAALILASVLCGVALSTAPVRGAGSTTAPFDGQWQVVITCPPLHEDDDGAKGYVHRFPAEIKNSVIRGTHGTEGQPSYHLLTGTIAPDGKAELKLDGIANKPEFSVNNAWRGKPYSYKVRAKFEPTSGSGVRVGRRKCDFAFNRAP